MNGTLVITGISLLILLVVSGFFSASETAFTSISKVQLRKLKKNKLKQDRLLLKILTDPARIITTILIGNNIVNIWASSLATAFAINMFGDEGIGIATLVMTVAILIFSEITPKIIATNNPLRIGRFASPIIKIIETLLFPLVLFFSLINSFLITIIKRFSPETEHRLTEDELKTMIAVGKKEGVLEKEEHDLLNRAFDLTDLKLREIMTPRTSIAGIPIDSSIQEIHLQFQKHRFSRMPVYSVSIDEIQGMIHYKDVLFLLEDSENGSMNDLIRPVLFVPETQTAFELLKEMEKHNQNMAIIIDEFGGTAGLITIDDVIAAVFGGIHDEYDGGQTEPLDHIIFLSTNHIRVPGNLKLTDLNALLKTDLDSEYYETIGGLIMELSDKLPKRSERIRFHNMVFSVEEQSNRKIQKVDILIDPPTV